MFTGIVGAVGRLSGRERRGGDVCLRVASAELGLTDVQLGDSIAVNGVCLTVVELWESAFSADVSQETLRHSCLGELPLGSRLNLEKALLPLTRLGGHFVAGHVDGVGTIGLRRPMGRAQLLQISIPRGLARYIAPKGSIAVDGVSLTVNAVGEDSFELAIIPHTLSGTIIEEYVPGRRVHLEVDIIARYLERLLQTGSQQESDHQDGLDLATLAAQGYVRSNHP